MVAWTKAVLSRYGTVMGWSCAGSENWSAENEELLNILNVRCERKKGVIDDLSGFHISKQSRRAAIYKDIEDCRKGKYRKEEWEFSFRHAKFEISIRHASREDK